LFPVATPLLYGVYSSDGFFVFVGAFFYIAEVCFVNASE
jgi:hypothetical protein